MTTDDRPIMVRHGLIWRAVPPNNTPQPTGKPTGPRPKPLTFTWTMDDVLDAYAAHRSGNRTTWAVEGCRLYRRISQRRLRGKPWQHLLKKDTETTKNRTETGH